jgi:hypothetical protein
MASLHTAKYNITPTPHVHIGCMFPPPHTERKAVSPTSISVAAAFEDVNARLIKVEDLTNRIQKLEEVCSFLMENYKNSEKYYINAIQNLNAAAKLKDDIIRDLSSKILETALESLD